VANKDKVLPQSMKWFFTISFTYEVSFLIN